MNYDFLKQFHPKIHDVVERNRTYWESFDYRIDRPRTQLHILALVLEGAGMIELDGERQALEPGCLFQVWPGRRMRITTGAALPLRFQSVQYHYALLRWENGQAIAENGSGPLPLPSVLPLGERTELTRLFARLYEAWQRKDADYEWEANVLLLGAVREAVRLFRLAEADRLPGAQAVSGIIRYINEHYALPLTREELAQRASMSPAYFSTVFKKNTGLSPVQFVQKVRLDQAKRLLREGTLPIAEVAREVGFADSFYFSRLFARETGLAPREYRKG